MFDQSRLDANDNLIRDCTNLIKQHNALSYVQVSLNLTSIPITATHKSQDPVSLQIIDFYQKYMQQLTMTERIKVITDTIAHTHEDLALHIDRSSDGIVEIFSTLTKNRMKLLEHHETLVANLKSASQSFINYIPSVVSPSTKMMEVIDLIFKLMTAHSEFIRTGSGLIESIYKSNELSTDHLTSIRELNSKLKHQLIESPPTLDTTKPTVNRLQTFGLTPNEGPNVSINEVLSQLFGMSVNITGSIADNIDKLVTTLKLVGSNTGTSVGSSNIDTYFDTTTLMNISKSFRSEGVSPAMIHTFDLVKAGSNPTVKTHELLSFNLDEDTKRAYALWTNDMKSFKYQSAPITQSLASKILRRNPSSLIESYNVLCEITIANARKEDAISFNRVKQMAFSESVTEESFVGRLQSDLVSSIMKQVGNLQGSKMTSLIIEPHFTQNLLTVFDGCKLELGVDPRALSAHCHIIYASVADKQVKKIKKELLGRTSIDRTETTDLIKSIIYTPDNIYARVIASYYLHIA